MLRHRHLQAGQVRINILLKPDLKWFSINESQQQLVQKEMESAGAIIKDKTTEPEPESTY